MTMTENEPAELETAVSPPSSLPAQPTDTEPPQEKEPPTSRKFTWESLTVILLILILACGAYFRFTGLDWDENFHLHPDERFLTMVASSLKTEYNRHKTMTALGEESRYTPFVYFKTSESTMNPYNMGYEFYVYGNFPITVTRIAAEGIAQLCQLSLGDSASNGARCPYHLIDYYGIYLVGRALSGLVDLVSILFLFLIGRRLYDWRVGLLGAGLLALAVMPIQQSHFFTTDNWAAALTTFTIYTAVRAASLGDKEAGWKLRWWAFFGLGLGLTVASRINVAPLAGMSVLAAILWLHQRGHQWRDWLAFKVWVQLTPTAVDMQRVVLGLMLAATVSMITFRVAQPYAFADAKIAREKVWAATGSEAGVLQTAVHSIIGLNPQFRSNMEEIQRMQQPDANFPPATQWVDRTPILFPLTNMVLYGMGLLAGLAAWFGFFWALWRLIKVKPDWVSHALPVAWSGVYFLFTAVRWVKSIRYFLPIYPTLLLLAAWALFAMWDRAQANDKSKQQYFRRILAGGLITAVGLYTFAWAWTFLDTYKNPVTRVAASSWIYEHIPSGATLIYETDGVEHEYALPLRDYQFIHGLPLDIGFEMPEDGRITAVRLNYLQTMDGTDGQVVTLAAGCQSDKTENHTVTVNSTRAPLTLPLPQHSAVKGSWQFITIKITAGSTAIQAGTSHLMNEHWDDSLPVSVNDRSGYSNYYNAVNGNPLPVTHPDSPEKQQNMVNWLDETDYIILSSQRALWSLPRIPLTYPLMIEFYRGLFSGELGFELVYKNQVDYHIGPLHISDIGGKAKWGEQPDVGWPPPGDLAAEEAFSVYDHPPVWIFAKTDEYSHENTIQVLGNIDWSKIVFMNPGEATQSPNAMMLSAEQRAVQQANGTFSEIFNVDGTLSNNSTLAAIVWWLTAVILGWLSFPLTYIILRGLPDKGYVLSRIFVQLCLSYFVWITASYSIFPNTRGTLLLGLGVILILSMLALWRHWPDITTFVRHNRKYILTVELLGISLFIIAIIIRLGNPDVWDVIWGGEKPMNLSYFNAILKSTTFPPYDPWYAGGYINYYYYGYVFVGVLTKLLGIVPTMAYNLIIPMLFSFTGLGTFSIAYNLATYRKQRLEKKAWQSTNQSPHVTSGTSIFSRQALAAGLIATILAVILGNLAEVGVMLDAWQKAGNSVIVTGIGGIDTMLRTVDGALNLAAGQSAPIYPGDWFWSATRAINYNSGETAPITEFPFFTFLYGDLHAHMISMSLQMLALGWAVSLALLPINQHRGTAGQRENRQSAWWETSLLWLTGALAIGALWPTNTWDWPTYLVLGTLAIFLYAYRQHDEKFSWSMIGQVMLQTMILAALSILLFLPYRDNFGSAYNSIKPWPGSYTHLNNYLVIWGLFLFFIMSYLLLEFRIWTKTWRLEGLRHRKRIVLLVTMAVFLFVLLLFLLMFKGYHIAPVALTLVIGAGLLGIRPELVPERRITLVLISASLALTLFVEFFVLAGDSGRMNTVFKIYMQVWLILSVVSGVVAMWVWQAIRRRQTTRTVWQITSAILVCAALLYPLLATSAKWNIRMNKEAPNSLDGMAFMEYVEYSDTNAVMVPLKYDYEAIQWMQHNIDGSPVIVEGHSHNNGEFSPYRSITNRVAMYTGLPAIVGWDWHQRQQRAILPEHFVRDRVQEVNHFYNTPDVYEAQVLLNKYDVKYVYLGQLEAAYYTTDGIAKFAQMVEMGMLQEVYQNDGVVIYEVLPSSKW
ncbi:MAG: hypothetical protein CSA11_10205 [Chloroflexi bacterium]|nr:MAG: hypothetical protein CSA11_10205 [Chloroflexota bacterium]